MANYAFVENNKVVGVYDLLPKNWKNVSNFYLLSDEELAIFNWYRLIKVVPEYTPETQRLGNPTHEFNNGLAYEIFPVLDIEIPIIQESVKYQPTEQDIEYQRQLAIDNEWIKIRQTRDELMKNFEWRYTRYHRQSRLGITTTDAIEELDAYMQQLADITEQSDPFAVQWPTISE
jgi:hypothetical protein